MGGGGLLGGVGIVGTGNDCLGARAQVEDIDEVDRDGVAWDRELDSENERECDCVCDNDEKSGKTGDAIRLTWLACDRESEGVPTLCLTGVTKEAVVVKDKLLVRWRDAKVEMAGFDEDDDIGPDTDRLDDTLDKRLFDLL